MRDSINPFAVLGLDETASRAQVDTAYRARARQLHPDRLGDVSVEERTAAESAMAEVVLAYQLLTDPAAREQYRRVQQRRRAAAARRGESLPTHPSRDSPAGGRQPFPPPPAPAGEATTYRAAASAEFAVDTRGQGAPWVAPRPRRGLFRRSRRR